MIKLEKTILFYINAIHEGGAERVIIQLAHHFAQSGYRSILVTSFIDDIEYDVPSDVIRLSLEQKQIQQSKFKRNYSRIKKLRKICKNEKPVCLISFMAEANFRAIIACMGLSTKCITSVRNDPNMEYAGKLGYFIGKFILPLSDGCVFQTEAAKEWFPNKLKAKSKIIFNAVDPSFFQVERKPQKNIVTLGRLCLQKNHKLLIKAFSMIKDKYSEWNLLIYGIGDQEYNLNKLIKKLKLDNRVFLEGLTNDSQKVLSEAGIFVLSSDYEGLPNSLIEAMVVGVPSISTDCPCGGPKMIIKDKENGLLVPINDEVRMAEALDRLLNDYDYAEKLGLRAHIDSKVFNPKYIFEDWKFFVEDIINK